MVTAEQLAEAMEGLGTLKTQIEAQAAQVEALKARFAELEAALRISSTADVV